MSSFVIPWIASRLKDNIGLMAHSPLLRALKRLIAQASLPENQRLSLEELRTTRRDFLTKSSRAALIAASALPAAQLLSACSTPRRDILQNDLTSKLRQTETKDSSNEPVIIIGAGIAGLTAAYTLSQAGHPCRIYEASNRVGGRMFTRENFNSEGMTCELGGEFVDTAHEDLIALCKKLGVELTEIASVDHGVETELYYFGRAYTTAELIPRFKPFARQLKTDLGRKDLYPKWDRTPLSKYLAGYRNSVDAWVLEMLRIAYVGEFGLEADQMSALAFMLTISPDTTAGFALYGESDQAFKIRGGNIALITALTQELARKNVPILLDHPLVAMKETTDALSLAFSRPGGATVDVSAKRVICTVPFTVLREVEGVMNLGLPPLKKEWIQTMAYGTNSKLMLGYKSQAWRRSQHPSSTKVIPSNGMVYTDLFVQNTWDTSAAQRAKGTGELGTQGILTVYLGGRDGAAASMADVSRSEQAIAKILPQTRGERTQDVSQMNWSKYRYIHGSYACPLPGQLSRYEDVKHVWELGGRLIFAGEHATDEWSGFMNGACHAGRVAAQTLPA